MAVHVPVPGRLFTTEEGQLMARAGVVLAEDDQVELVQG